jgi:tetratricopeptide (TPR) repeat protein
MKLLAGIVLAFLALPQEKAPTVEEVLKLMESKAADLKDLSYEVVTGGEFAPLTVGRTLRVAWIRGSGCRISSASSGAGPGGMMEEQMMQFYFGGMSEVDFIYGKDAFLCFGSRTNTRAPGLASVAQRIAYDDPIFPAFDPFQFPSTIPLRLLMDEPLAYYLVDPRFFFRFEPNLAHQGLRVENGRRVHVITSSRGESAARKKVLKGMFELHVPRKEFHIDAESGAILRIQWDFVYTSPAEMGEREQKSKLILDPSGSRKVTDKLSIPESVGWTWIEGERGGHRQNRMIVHTFRNFKVNSGLAPQDILTPAEATEVFADAVLLGKEEYDARLAKNPSDASAVFSRALALALPSADGMMRIVMGGGAPAGGTEEKELKESLEKLVELRPDAESPTFNLFHLVARHGDPKDLIARIEKENRPLPGLRLALAAWCNDNGKHDDALRHVDAAKPAGAALRRRAAVERLVAQLARKEDAAAATGFREESARCPGTPERIFLVRAIEARLTSAGKSGPTPARAAEVFEATAKAQPSEIAPLLALAWLNTREFSAKGAASVSALLKAASADPDVAGFALEILSGHFDPPADPMAGARFGMDDPDEPEEPDKGASEIWPREGTGALVAALEGSAAGKDDPKVPYLAGRALEASGDVEGAKKRYEAAFKAASAVKPGEATAASAGGILYRVALRPGPKKPEAWLEDCVEALLTVAPGADGINPMLLYDESTNPVVKLATARVRAGEWMKFYALATRNDQAYLGAGSSVREALNERKGECAAACLKAVLEEAKDPAPLKKYARFAQAYVGDEGTDEALARALELSPKDVEVLALMADVAGRRQQHAKSVEALEKMLPHLATPVTTPEGTHTAENIRLRLAQAHSALGDPAKAKAALGLIDLKAPGAKSELAMSVGELYGTLKEPDLAIVAYLRARDLGAKPNLQLGRLHEKKEDWYEALRWYNRDILEGSGSGAGGGGQTIEGAGFEMDEDEEAPAPGKKPGEEEPKNGKEARERLLAKVSEDFFINRHLGQKFEALGAEEAKSLKGSIEKLGSHDLADRDAATAAIRKAGPKASPLLAEPSKSADPEIRGRARKLLMEWAEPR